jgi:hypothetical protein
MGHRVASSTLAVIARRGLSPGGSTGPAARDCPLLRESACGLAF